MQKEIFEPTVTDNKVMTGKNDQLCRQAIRFLSEAVERLGFEIFFDENKMDLREIVEQVHRTLDDENLFREKWDAASDELNRKIFTDYQEFLTARKDGNDKWKYWSNFSDVFVPIVIDLTRSFREGDWELYLLALRRAIPLFFAFGHTNYSRWAPIHYEDCSNLFKNFPLLHSAFINGDFVVQLTLRRGSSLPMDQALEMTYNKPAKGAGGVIGFTRRKEAVATWNLIKHEKSEILSVLDNVCGLKEHDEYSTHHKYSPQNMTRKIYNQLYPFYLAAAICFHPDHFQTWFQVLNYLRKKRNTFCHTMIKAR